MDKHERDMFAVVNRNHECKALADKLNAISARRRKRKSLWRPMKSAAAAR